MSQEHPSKPESYLQLLDMLKERIGQARVKAAAAVNSELVMLYWNIGRDILARQEREGWGAKVLERLSRDLRGAFPGVRGLSARNLSSMRDLAREWPERAILQQLVAKLPWGHNISILQRVKDREERLWTIRACIENGWSRNVLEMQIESGLYHRRGTISNFERTLPAAQSDLARELLKDPYNFEFLGLSDDANERVIERGLIEQVRRLLLELGQGFAFVGHQVPLDIGGDRFYLDLLFSQVPLHCFVVEYSLRDMSKPLGVSQYGLTASLPAELRGSLPSVEELEAGLQSLGQEES